MASLYLRRKCADHRPSSSATTPRRFIKVILDDTCRDRKLGIPKSFLENYGGDLSNWVYFKLPCCPEVKIGLTSFNGDVWFRKGWPEFSKLYSLEKGYLLLFGYEGDSRFQVSIFDGSNDSMEINYTTRRMLGSEESDQYDDMSLDVLEDIRPTALLHKENRPVLSPTTETNVDSEELSKKETHWSKLEMTRKDHFVAERDGGGKETKRFRRAKSYKCSFKVPMHSTCINQKLLWLPKAFVKTYLVKQPKSATLIVLGGKKNWPVKLIYEESKGRVKFQPGWTDFVRDTHLKEGDICEFVLVDSNRLVFEVKITTTNRTLSPDIDDGNDEDHEEEYEDEDDSDDESIKILDHFPQHLKRMEKYQLESQLRKRKHSSTQIFPGGRPEVRKMHPPVTVSSGLDMALQRANDFKSANPYFKISIRPSYIHGRYLYVPAKFAKRYLVKQPTHAILQIERKRTWSVYFHYDARRTTFQSGWSAFLQDNDLKEGDACVFMLTDKIKFLFDVVIFRST